MSHDDIEQFDLSPLQDNLVAGFADDLPQAVFAVRIEGRLDKTRLQEAVTAMMEQHEVLATTFTKGRDGWCQMVTEEEPTWLDTRPQEEVATPINLLTQDPDFEGGVQCRLIKSDNAHILIIRLHGLAADTATPEIFVAQLAQCYQDPDYEPPENGMQYIDFAEWQVKLLEKEQAKDAKPAVPIEPMAIHGRINDQGFLMAVHSATIGPILAGMITEHKIDPTIFYLACWQFFLRTHLQAGQVQIGLDLSGRNHEALKDTLGIVDTVVPVSLDGAGTIGACAAHVNAIYQDAEARRGRYFGALNHGHTPRYGFSRRMARKNQEANGVTFSTWGERIAREPYDLNLVYDHDGNTLVLQSNSRTIPNEQAEDLLAGFQSFVTSVAEHPTRPLDRHPLVGPSEARLQIKGVNDNTLEIEPACLHTCIEQQALKTPDRIAVKYLDGCITYEMLNQRANRIAHFLLSRGVNRGDRVALCLGRSTDLISIMLGIWKTGAAYAPFETTEAPLRLSGMIKDSGAGVLFIRDQDQSALKAHLPEHMTLIDPGTLPLADMAQTNPEIAVDPDDLAYIIYTSGSTGKPKGVEMAHHSPLNLLQGLKKLVYREAQGLTVSVNAPFSFDASIQQIIMLSEGHTLDIVPHETRVDSQAFVSFLNARMLDGMDGTPTHLAALMQGGLLQSAPIPKHFLIAGGMVDQTMWDTLAAAATDRFYNIYGPTECCVDATGIPIDSVGALTSIGGPLANYQIYLLNKAGHLAPTGTPGEILIGGKGLARGYLNQPAMTAERFVPHPYSTAPGQRLYKTGDLARFNRNGRLLFMGRIDSQVKLRGYRIEPAEIDQVLLEHEAITQAVTLARTVEELGDEKRLVAYVTATGNTDHLEQHLRAFLRERLPEHMVPPHYVVLETMPLKVSGKIDHAALPEPHLENHEEVVHNADTKPMIELLAGLWSDILGTPHVGLEDDFFELGGHSLLTIQLVGRIRNVFNIDVNLLSFFNATDLESQARLIEETMREGSGIKTPPLTPAPDDGPSPLSFSQQRLWMIQRMDTSSTAYHIPFALKVSGSLDVGVMEQALREVIARHHVLRTRFAIVADQPVQLIDPAPDFQITLIDAQDMTVDQKEAYIDDATALVIRTPFDLERGPLLRMALVRLDAHEHVALFTLHHIISDGWSTGVLVRELRALYGAFGKRRPSPLKALPIQYSDYARWQRDWLKGDVYEAELSYWRDTLDGMPHVQTLPYSGPRIENGPRLAGNKVFQLPDQLAETLQQVCHREEVTLFMLMLAAFNALIQGATDCDDMIIGTDIANRSHQELEGLIGFFINQLVLRVDLTGNPTFREMLKRTRRTAMDAYLHQDFPFDKLVEALSPRRQPHISPLFQTKFMLQNTAEATLDLPGLTLQAQSTPATTVQIDLQLNIIETEQGQLAGVFLFNRDLYSDQAAARLVEHYQLILQKIAETIDITAAEIKTALLEETRRQAQTQQAERKKDKQAMFRNMIAKKGKKGPG